MRPVALTVALAVSLLTGCGDATGPEGIAGNYTLRTVNGQELPVIIIQVLDEKIEVTAGSWRINSDETFSTSLTLATTTGGTTTSETGTNTGTYILSGSAITFTFQDGSTANGPQTDDLRWRARPVLRLLVVLSPRLQLGISS